MPRFALSGARRLDEELKCNRNPRLCGEDPDLANTYPNINPNKFSMRGQFSEPRE